MAYIVFVVLTLLSFPVKGHENQVSPAPTGYLEITPQPTGSTGGIAPEQPAIMNGSIESSGQKRIAPEQPSFGIHPRLRRMGARAEEERSEPEDEGPDLSADFSELRQINTAIVDQIIDPLRIRLTNGQIVQLAGIDTPDLDPYEPGEISLAARDRLADWLAGRHVRIFQTPDRNKGRVNRMGYELVHLQAGDDDQWVQGALLAAGLARVRPTARNPEMAAQMIALEDYARENGKGLWAEERFDVLTPETADKAVNGWGIVEGRVHSVGTGGNTVYLNFGPNWRTAFSVSIDGNRRRQLAAAGIDAQQLGGKTVRVRGWVEDYNGPYIELIHPAWLEVRDIPSSPPPR